MVGTRQYCVSVVVVLLAGLLHGCSQPMDAGDWKRLEPLVGARSGFSAIVRGNKIYVIGGIGEAGYLKGCEWATIRADGTIDGWKETSPLNTERVHAGVAAVNRYVYVIGGAGGRKGRPLHTVERARINPDGSLDGWVMEESRLTTPRFGAATIVSGGYIYAIGGYAERPLRTIERARINPDGSLGRWQLVGELPHPSYMHATIVVRDHIYLVGGRTPEGASRDVFVAELERDGTIKSWHRVQPLNTPRYGASAIVLEDRIYVGGGHGSEDVYTIEAASVTDDASLSEWKKVLELPLKAGGATMVAYRDVIYIIGGVYNNEYISDVYKTRME